MLLSVVAIVVHGCLGPDINFPLERGHVEIVDQSFVSSDINVINVGVCCNVTLDSFLKVVSETYTALSSFEVTLSSVLCGDVFINVVNVVSVKNGGVSGDDGFILDFTSTNFHVDVSVSSEPAQVVWTILTREPVSVCECFPDALESNSIEALELPDVLCEGSHEKGGNKCENLHLIIIILI